MSSPCEFRERDTRFPQDHTQDNANLFQEAALRGWRGSAFRWRRTKTKNLRVALPRGDAEDLIWKPESRCKIVASYGPFDLSWTQAHRRGGQAVNPSQVGFHLIKRECPPIPFTPRRKNAILSTRVSRALPRLLYPIDATWLIDAEDSSPGTAHSPGAPPAA